MGALFFKNKKENIASSATNFFELSAKSIDFENVDMSRYKEKKCIIVVNVATKWGLTKENYTQLTRLHNEYKEKGLEILGFPCNQFMGQEPGNEAQIKEYVHSTYNATFPLFAKVEVNGPHTHPVYAFLRNHSSLK